MTVAPRAALSILLDAAERWGQAAFKVKGSLSDVRRRMLAQLPAARELYRKAAAKKKDIGDLPPDLRYLVEALIQEIQNVTGDLADGDLTVSQWESDMLDLLARYYPAANMTGLGTSDLTDTQVDDLVSLVSAQADFLKDFALEIQGADDFMPGWNARAESYAGGIKEPYWDGETDMLPLPAMPGDGTSQCLGNCNCAWRVEPLDEEAGDYDCYWELESGSQHCQTCTERASQWGPLEIRGFELQ